MSYSLDLADCFFKALFDFFFHPLYKQKLRVRGLVRCSNLIFLKQDYFIAAVVSSLLPYIVKQMMSGGFIALLLEIPPLE